MRKEIEISGCVEIPPETTMDEFWHKFIVFVEENKWSFGGGMREIHDGCYIKADGSRGKSIVDA